MVFDAIHAAGYRCGEPQGLTPSMQSFRLSVWAYRVFRSFDLIYEFDSRLPDDPLTQERTQHLGALMAQQFAAYVLSDAFVPFKQEMTQKLAPRKEAREKWFRLMHHNPLTRTPDDLLTYGY